MRNRYPLKMREREVGYGRHGSVALGPDRLDANTGTVETVGLYGAASARRFGTRYRPASPNGHAVLICSSLHAEADRHHRREVEIARALAAAGFTVHRFQYRGAGNSDDVASLTFSSLLQDATAELDHLTRLRSGGILVVGVRLGALVAAALSSGPATPLVLIAPLADGLAYFKDAFRAWAVAGVVGGLPGKPSGSALDELQRTGSIDAMGFEVSRDLYESLESVSLRELLRGVPRSIQWISVGPSAGRVATTLVTNLIEDGHRVTQVRYPYVPNWWSMGHELLPGDLEAAEMIDPIIAFAARELR